MKAPKVQATNHLHCKLRPQDKQNGLISIQGLFQLKKLKKC